MSGYVYIRTEHSLWTVGFYTPDGVWKPESDHDSKEEAAKRVHWLNGTEKERDEAGAEAKRLKEILQGLVKNRNRAMVSEKPTFYFEQMQPFWRQAEQALKEGGGK